MSSNINLASLTKEQGFTIIGAPPVDIKKTTYGRLVNSAGDVNEDGFADIIIGDPVWGGVPNYPWGCVWIISGNNETFQTINLQNPNEDIPGWSGSEGDYLGYSVSGAGDINGDGYNDIVFGSPGTARVDIIYGKKDPLDKNNFPTTINYYSGIGFGKAVSGTGDVNGDGYDDIIIGAPDYSNKAGISYIIYGDKSKNEVNLSHGIKIYGANSNDQSGYSVSSAGDINKDGYDDIIIGTKGNGAYVIYGNKTELLNDITLSPTNNNNYGFFISGVGGYSVSGAGDINGDGYDDIIIGNPYANPNGQTNAGASYVVFGKANNYNNINLANFTNTQGFSIIGINTNDNSGYSVSGAGDINKDGYADVIIGAPYANCKKSINDCPGASYIIYGNKTFTNLIDLASLTAEQGFSLIGADGDLSGSSVSGAGDINKDGYDDIIIKAYYKIYVVRGAQSGFVTQSPTFLPTTPPTSVPAVLSTTESWWNSLGFKLASIIGMPMLSFGAAWIFREKISFYILSNWGYEYKLLHSDTTKPLPANEVGFRLFKDKENNTEKLVCKVKNKYVNVEIDNGNNNGISKGLYNNIYEKLKQSYQVESFVFLQSEKNQLRDFLLSRPKLLDFKDLGYIKGNVYQLCLNSNYKQRHEAKYHYERRIDDSEELLNVQDGYMEVEIDELNEDLLPTNWIGSTRVEINDQSPRPSEDNTQKWKASTDCIVCAVHSIKYDDNIIDQLFNRKAIEFDIKLSQVTNIEKIKLISDSSYSDVPKLSTPASSPSYMLNSLLEARQLIEYIPLVKYVAGVTYSLVEDYLPESTKSISFPEISKTTLFSAHLAAGHLGAVLLPTESITKGLIASTAGSASFGIRLAASHYLSEQASQALSQGRPMDTFEVTKYCAATMLGITVPSIATCALAKAIMPSYQCGELALSTKISLAGAECYSVYKVSTKTTEAPTTADIIIPYIADGIAAVAAYANGYEIMTALSTVVTADWMSKMAMDMVPTEVKEVYVDSAFSYVNECITDCVSQIGGIVQYYLSQNYEM